MAVIKFSECHCCSCAAYVGTEMHSKQKKIIRSPRNINIAIFLCLCLDNVCRQSISIEASELKRWVDDTETKAVNRHAKLFAQLAACLRDIQLSLLHSSFMCGVPRYGYGCILVYKMTLNAVAVAMATHSASTKYMVLVQVLCEPNQHGRKQVIFTGTLQTLMMNLFFNEIENSINTCNPHHVSIRLMVERVATAVRGPTGA